MEKGWEMERDSVLLERKLLNERNSLNIRYELFDIIINNDVFIYRRYYWRSRSLCCYSFIRRGSLWRRRELSLTCF